jgi:hypothetical protein
LAGGATQGWGQLGHEGLEPVGQVLLATAVVVGVVAPGIVVVAAGVAGDQHSGHRAVAGQPPTRLRAQWPGPAGLAPDGAGAANQAVQVDGDGKLGADAAGLGQLTCLQGAAGEFGEGVGAALVAAAGIVGAGRAGQGLQGGG